MGWFYPEQTLPQAGPEEMVAPVGRPGTVKPSICGAAPGLNSREGVMVTLISSPKNGNVAAVAFISFWENQVRERRRKSILKTVNR